ncbi:fungal specific transcription factor domain-containing protein [Aspergillus affinis]|uniref:fungal specific transcription factor domain-containing protein n=1 Tax=Aspergillus affinis TaxID=1070780 RepID=UPI0022FF01FF|nr:uncharacterized protein KD926_011155 [Aspergillus affinis]KAI9038216.1 hypothetical protein KD926_011155 [Aspergillus affinis]
MESLSAPSRVFSETTLEKRASKVCLSACAPNNAKLFRHAKRDPSLHLILDHISQLNRAFQSVEGRMSRMEDKIQRSNSAEMSNNTRTGAQCLNHPNIIVGKTGAEPQPTSSILRWERIRLIYPNVARQSVDGDACSAYSSTIQPSLKSLVIQAQPNETGQVLFYTRCFLDLVYPLYPIMCEDAIYDAVTNCIKDGFQNNMTSALVMLMVCLGKLYSSLSSVDEAIGYLNMATQLLAWLPMEASLDYAQAHGLRVLKSQGTKLTTRTTSIRLYWVLLNMERHFNWETSLKSSSELSELEDRLPLPFKCMAQEPSTANQLHSPYTSVIDSCYSLFLAETSLRQILWRIACAPELQESTAHVPQPSRAFEVIAELEMQLSEWLVCIPGSAGWSPVAGAGNISALSSRIKLQYWLCRFHIYKVALYRSFQVPYQMIFPESISQTWSDAALVAAMNSLLVFVSENVIPDDIMAHRLLTITILLRASMQLFGPERLVPYCQSMSTSPQSLIDRSVERIQSLSIMNSPMGAPKWQSRWVTNSLQTFLQDISAEAAQP